MSPDFTDERVWSLTLEVTPSEDGRFFQVKGTLRKPSTRVPVNISLANTTDLMFEKIEGEVKNALRHMINDINSTVIQPGKNARRGK